MGGLDYPRSPGFDRLGLWAGRGIALIAAAAIGAVAYARFVTGIQVSDGTNIYRSMYGDTKGYRAAQAAAGAEVAQQLAGAAVMPSPAANAAAAAKVAKMQ
jgi:hypothetical protein